MKNFGFIHEVLIYVSLIHVILAFYISLYKFIYILKYKMLGIHPSLSDSRISKVFFRLSIWFIFLGSNTYSFKSFFFSKKKYNKIIFK